jgi:hypothetical protein
VAEFHVSPCRGVCVCVSGQMALHVAEKLLSFGAVPITLSDSSGTDRTTPNTSPTSSRLTSPRKA